MEIAHYKMLVTTNTYMTKVAWRKTQEMTQMCGAHIQRETYVQS